jgi:type IV secretion system protein VirD4
MASIFDDFPRGHPKGHERAALKNAPLATASWSADAPLWREGDLYLGQDDRSRDAGYGDDRHAITVAGSRAGKGRTIIIPNLFRWPGSCVVTDPKGENATVTALHRSKRPGHAVAVLDPCKTADVPEALRVSFNPLDLIDAESDDAIDLAAAIGDAVMIGSGDGKDIHWNESARQVFEGILLYVAATEDDQRRSLVRVRQLLTQGDRDRAKLMTAISRAESPDGEGATVSPFEALWTGMAENEAANEAVRDVIAGAAISVMDMGENERGSVLSTARRNTKFIDSRWMRRCLEGDDASRRLNLDELKAAPGGLSVYLCLPARFIPTHARFMRLVLNLTLFRMEAQGLTQPACGHPVLFILDEFAALGRMDAIEKAAGLMAGFGVKLWPFLQDLGQLKRHYKESWETFLGNAGVLQFFANADMTTLEWISKRLGKVEVVKEMAGKSISTTTSLSSSQSQTENTGWSTASGTSEGQSDMAELQSLAARDGGSGLVPFLARSSASVVGHSSGRSVQKGQSGGSSQQRGESSSSGTSDTSTQNEGIHIVPLMTPDEISRIFDRESGICISFIKGIGMPIRRNILT